MSYEVTECVPCSKTKYRVTLDGDYTVQLYNSEVRKFGIKTEGLLSEESFVELQEILYKRGLSRCLHLVKDRDYTQSAFEKKLREGDYPIDIINRIVERLIKEGFINDGRYAKNYVVSYMNSKSRKQITQALVMKGINSSLIEAAFDDVDDLYGTDTEVENVKRLLKKKLGTSNPNELDYNQRMKVFAYVGRKGYEFEMIKKAWDNIINNDY